MSTLEEFLQARRDETAQQMEILRDEVGLLDQFITMVATPPPLEQAERKPPMESQTSIVALQRLGDHGSVQEIAKEINTFQPFHVSVPAVRRALSHLLKKGQVTRTRRGVYQVVAQEEQQKGPAEKPAGELVKV